MYPTDADIVTILKSGKAKIIITSQNTLVSFFSFLPYKFYVLGQICLSKQRRPRSEAV